MIDYATEFRIFASVSKWNAAAIYDAFYHGLSETLKDLLAARVLPETLDGLVDLAIRIDQRMRERLKERSEEARPLAPKSHSTIRRCSGSSISSDSSGAATQLGHTRLNPEERQRRFRANLCLYCGGAGHVVRTCPVKDRAQRETESNVVTY